MNLGVLGGGQLGRMLALAGHPLGIGFRILESNNEVAAGPVADVHVADYNDERALAAFCAGLDLVTYEFENIPVATAAFIAQRVPVYPPIAALETAQDRFLEKSLFQKLGIPVPPFQCVESEAELNAAIATIGAPCVLKRRRLGYDGKGQRVIRTIADAPAAWAELSGAPLILEAFVPFERELSVLAVRRVNGDVLFYPLVENHHEGGILRLSLAPAPELDISVQREAEDFARRVLNALNYVGVLAIEFFQKDGHLYANEMAPRVHNSGHWTIEGAETSQFENHLRAILDLPLGPTTPIGSSAMFNLIGTIPATPDVLAVANAHLHLYGKAPKPGRKLGHITITAETPVVFEERRRRISELVVSG